MWDIRSRTGSILAMTSENIVKGQGFNRISLEERWDPVEFEGCTMAAQGAESSGTETTHACWWRGCTSSDYSRNPWRTTQSCTC